MSEPLSDEEIVTANRDTAEQLLVGIELGYSARYISRLLATIAAREQTIKGMQEAFVRDTATIEELTAEVARAVAQAERVQGHWSGRLSVHDEALGDRIVLLEAALRVAIELLTACRSDYSCGGSGDVQEFLDGSYPALLSPLSEPGNGE